MTTANAPAVAAGLNVALLGPLLVRVFGQSLELGGTKQKTLLAALALEANSVVSDDRLIEILWGSEPPEGATDVLRVHVHRLRRTLDEIAPRSGDGNGTERRLLERNLTGYSVLLEADQLDVSHFRGLVRNAQTTAREGALEDAVRLFDDALALWRGPALAEFGDAPFAAGARSHLDKLRLDAQEDRFALCLRMGLHHENVAALEELAAHNALRERLQGQLLLALYRCGRQAEASDTYQRTRQRLVDELGMEPGPELQATFREILRQEVEPIRPSDALATTLRPIEPGGRHSNLPADISRFIGRGNQIAEVCRLLAANRHVTLIGPGGIGKTRLALQVANRLLPKYNDGVWLVDLASLSAAETVPHQILTSLGLREQPTLTPTKTLIAHLERRELLLLIDNCEHLLDATAELARELLLRCARLSILATSRERLRLDGEQTWSVPSLDIPNPLQLPSLDKIHEHDAIALFVERARSVRCEFGLTENNAADVAQLCVQLGGIPLALEIAAARSAGLSPGQLLQHLGDQFGGLTAGRRASVSRHRTMKETIDWSYRLLTVNEQILFHRLSVFVASFDLPTAEAVCADETLAPATVVELMSRLVDKSLVVYSDAVAGAGRYRLLEPIRQFGQEKLADEAVADLVRRRHANHYAHAGAAIQSRYYQGQTAEPKHDLDSQYSNARAALEWAEGADGDLFVRLAAAWSHYWWVHGLLSEGRGWLRRAVGLNAGTSELRARALYGFGRLAGVQGDDDEAEHALISGLRFARAAGDSFHIALILNGLGVIALRAGDVEGAEARFRGALTASTQHGFLDGVILGNNNLGECAFQRGDADTARACFQTAIQIGGGRRPIAVASAHHSLANLERQVGNYSAARANAAHSLRIAQEAQTAVGVATAIEMFAFIAAGEEQPFRATVLGYAAATLYGWCGAAPDLISCRADAEQRLTQATERLDDSDLVRARHIGSRMTTDDAIAYALDGDRAEALPF